MDFFAGFGGFSVDLIALAGIIVVFVLDALRNGIGRAASVALALPLALMLHTLLASAAFLGELDVLQSGTGRIASFALVAACMYVLIRRMGLDYLDTGSGGFLYALLAGTAATVVCAVVWVHEPALTSLFEPSAQLAALVAESHRFWLLLSAYAALAFARG